jgi:hypothetical protein
MMLSLIFAAAILFLLYLAARGRSPLNSAC